MKLREFFGVDNNKDYDPKEEYGINFDIGEDLIVFIKNDPQFYRRKFFPAVKKMNQLIKKNKDFNPKEHMEPVVDSAMISYCKKFDVARDPSEIFTDEEKADVLNQLISDELQNIRNGEYDEY